MNFSAAKMMILGSTMLLSVSSQGTEFDDFSLDGEFAAMDGTQFEMPVVLTAARLRQSQLDTPASVTVIESDTIAALGFKNIEEIFRLVPGMLVGYHSGFGEKAPSVSYHGTNASEHRRLQVLVDGRSVFKPGLARVDWVDIPLAVEDIARIEVIRGPNSAAYGANSYLGIINILTKHPSDEKGTTIKITAGNREVADSYINLSNRILETDYRLTIGTKNKSGFDVQEDLETDNRDSAEATYTMLRTFSQLSQSISMEWQLGYKEGVNEQIQTLNPGFVEYFEPEDIDATDTFLWTRLNQDFSKDHAGRFQAYSERFDRVTEWDACINSAIVNPCGELNQNLDERKTEIEYQFTSTWSETLRTVMGARYRLDQLDSETYNDGYSENSNYSVFANVEHKYDSFLTTNIGGMYEKDDLNGENFSPRYAFNFHINRNHTFRFIYSEAIRSPDLYEKSGQRILTLAGSSLAGAGDDPFIYGIDLIEEGVRVATGLVENETIYSHEISYFGLFPSIQGQLDIKLFYDDLNGLITQALDHDPVKPLSSDNKVNHQGIEGRFNWDMNSQNKLLVSFSYLDVDWTFDQNNVDASRENSLSADRSGSLSWISELSNRTLLGLAYYHVENWNEVRKGSTGGFTFSRMDASLTHEVALSPDYTLKLQGTVQYRIDDDPLLFQRNNYEDREHYYLSARVNF